MRILIAAKHPPKGQMPIGGVQTWSQTIAEELENLGHQVVFWGPEWSLPVEILDFGIFANCKHTKLAFHLCKKILKVSHGIVPDEIGGDVFTSEEVRDFWAGHGEIVRQPINLDFWKPEISTEKKYLTRFSYRSGLQFLPKFAKEFGLEFIHISKEEPSKVLEILQQSSLVLATGRAAVEAMACGANVLIADDRPYQKPLVDSNTIDSMTRNYSGRGGLLADSKNLFSAIEKRLSSPQNLIEHVVQNHDSKKISRQILCSLY